MTADRIEMPGGAIAVLDADGDAVAVALPDREGGYVDVGLLGTYKLGPVLNAEASAVVPVRCGGAGANAQDALTGLLEFIASRSSRAAYAAQNDIPNRAALLAATSTMIDNVTGESVPADHLDIERQLLAGVPEESVVVKPTMPVVLLPFESSSTDGVFFVDEQTGHLLGAVALGDETMRVSVGLPSPNGSLDVYVARFPQLECGASSARVAEAILSLGLDPVVRIGASWLTDHRPSIDLLAQTFGPATDGE
jgi:hypothetical protein